MSLRISCKIWVSSFWRAKLARESYHYGKTFFHSKFFSNKHWLDINSVFYSLTPWKKLYKVTFSSTSPKSSCAQVKVKNTYVHDFFLKISSLLTFWLRILTVSSNFSGKTVLVSWFLSRTKLSVTKSILWKVYVIWHLYTPKVLNGLDIEQNKLRAHWSRHSR